MSKSILERQIQKQFITHLSQKEGYVLYPSNLNVDDLNAIFIENVERLNSIKLSSVEAARLLSNMEVSQVEAYKQFRYGVELVRDDNEFITVKLADMNELSNNEFGVLEELRINALKQMRLDVVILLNGVPLMTLELKRPANGKGVQDAIGDLNKYTISGAYRAGLLKFLQLYAASDEIATRYFSVSVGSEHTSKYGSGFPWTDEKNNRVNRLLPHAGRQSFAETFMKRENLYNMFRRYTLCIEGASPKIMVLRPYQIYAVEAGIERLNSTENNGFFWHATGSGKTLTSFMLTKAAAQGDKFDKVIMLLDRNDLATQTVEEYTKFDIETQKVVKGLALQQAFTNSNSTTIITTIQSFNNLMKRTAKNKKVNKQLKKNTAFIIDECHRSTFGKMFQRIVKRTEKAQFIGFTGTPILAENKTVKDQVTTTIFGDPIHIYTIQNAIEDKNVLPFSLREIKVTSSDKSVELNRSYYQSANRLEQIADYVSQNLRRHTEQVTEQKNLKNGFTAMLAADSISSAYSYWKMLTPKLKEQGRNTALIFSVQAKGDTGLNGENPTTQWILEAAEHHDEQFGTNFHQTMLSDMELGRKAYLADIMKKVRSKEIDLLIVSDMLLTGFDAQTLNTIYLDKNLEYHGLLQAMSRTNRTCETSATPKNKGNVFIFTDRGMQERVDETIKLYSNGGNVDTVVERKTYADIHIETYEALREIEEEYPAADDISSIRSLTDLILIASKLSKVRKNIQLLQTFDEWDDTHSWVTLRTDETTLSEYIAAIVNRRNDLTTPDNDEETRGLLAELDYEIEAGKTTLIDVAYINELLRNMVLSPEKERQKWADRMKEGIKNSTDPHVKRRSKAMETVLDDIEGIETEQDFWDRYDEAINKQIEEALAAAESTLSVPKEFLKSSVEHHILSGGSFDTSSIRAQVRANHPGLKFSEQREIANRIQTVVTDIAELTEP